ncbi:hypothetical protein BJY14_005735 [Actinomadura luteofluorescens]|uniref:DUF4913 domain-containing protein n=1 Tax=Actinomadura luteofluorescens TaxID=46163 RepID=A0A7Y9EL87_9ACTN|nr:DUF4913 domain-containing protein [Actinomadura luteofluorescens]NYD49752.1 hypothetical protein [Actinomadura luteofluorescens]
MTDSPDGLAEDLADLRAVVEIHGHGLARHAEVIKGLRDRIGSPASIDADETAGRPDDEHPLVPSFLLYLDGPEHTLELETMAKWVNYLLVPVYINQVSPLRPWCSHWWEHPEALARLHALWIAWQGLTDAPACGHTGPSVWHRDHLDPALARLRAPDGPFAECMLDPARPAHNANPATPIEDFGSPLSPPE